MSECKCIDDGGPAFPTPAGGFQGKLTVRDYLAAKAMQGMLANTDDNDAFQHTRGNFAAALAANAYEFADAMLKERSQ